MRSTTTVRRWCCTAFTPRKPIRKPNRKLTDIAANTTASTDSQTINEPKSPVATARSIAIPMTTGTIASAT